MKSVRKQGLRDKALHGQFFGQTENVSNENNWLWLKNAALKRETEALIMACQEQAIRTNVVKTRIDKSQSNSKCRMCGQTDETINHILNECSKLAQSEYKRRHDWIGRRIHWEVCRQYNVRVPDKWYEHLPERVIENEQVKVLWDFNIQTDRVIEARRPDLVIIDKEKKQVHIVDFAVPFDSRVVEKEKEKIEKYQDLARELKKIWNMKVKVVPIVLRSLGTIPPLLTKRLEGIGIRTRIVELQKTALLNSARIVRKVLEL